MPSDNAQSLSHQQLHFMTSASMFIVMCAKYIHRYFKLNEDTEYVLNAKKYMCMDIDICNRQGLRYYLERLK